MHYAIPKANGTEITSTITDNFPVLAIGNINGSKINDLTGYTTSGITGDVEATDNLLTALAKIENKADTCGVTSFGGATGAITLGNHISMTGNKLNVDATGTGILATQGDITAAIEGLDVTAITGTASQTITSISETDGKIAATYSNISIASSQINDLANTYSSTGTVAITGTGVSAALGTLDASTVATAVTANAASGTGTTVTLRGVKEDNGIISHGEGIGTFTIGDGALKLSGYGETTSGENPTIPTVAAADVFSANDTDDSTIALGNEFILNTTNKTICLRTNQAVAADNNIATMKDIASLTGAMHYKGGVTAYPTPTADTKAGDTYVVTIGFTESGVTYEVGDMLVANADGASATYTVVQSNMTIGVAQGQVASNSAALTSGKIVVASGTGIETSSYAVTDIASEAVNVSETSGTVTVSDTLTVGGTAQQAQSFTITGEMESLLLLVKMLS